MILIVPGNPGLASFYEVPPHIINTHSEQNCTDLEREKNAHHFILQEFMLVLQKELSDDSLSIWAVSHIGFIMFITITACNGTSTGVSFVDLPHILAEAAKYVI